MVSGTPWETVTLTTLSRDRALFPPLLAEARDAALRGQEGRLVVHTAWGTEWRPFGLPRRKRPLHSVVLAPGTAEKITEDVRAFLERREWYADRGGFLPFQSLDLKKKERERTVGLMVRLRDVKVFRIAEATCSMDRRDQESLRSFRPSPVRCRTTYAC
jgi:hypothetical protein